MSSANVHSAWVRGRLNAEYSALKTSAQVTGPWYLLETSRVHGKSREIMRRKRDRLVVAGSIMPAVGVIEDGLSRISKTALD